jgi:HPt (histidine-containing phosphotransfer) domain-containing protein
VLDRAELLKQVGRNWDFLRRIVTMFEEDYPPLERSIEAAVAAGDPQALHLALHKLKGILKNLHAVRALATLDTVERCGQQGDNAGAEQSWRRLQADVTEFQRELRRIVESSEPSPSKTVPA